MTEKMKVFLSWSGKLSHRVALELRIWLPSVIQTIEPFVSSEDTDKGARWTSDIVKQFEESRFGILCITPENIEAPWICFEAGALSNTIERKNVCPFLLGVRKTQLTGPLLLFQATTYDKADIRRLVGTLNTAPGGARFDEKRIDNIFEVWWPRLKEKLDQIDTELGAQREDGYGESIEKEQERVMSKMLEEILDLTRSDAKLLRRPELLFPPKYVTGIVDVLSLRRDGSHLGVNSENPVWQDLREALADARTLNSRAGKRGRISPKDVKSVLSRLVGAVEYIVARIGEGDSNH